MSELSEWARGVFGDGHFGSGGNSMSVPPISPADREILVRTCTEARNDRPILIHPSAVLSLDAALTQAEDDVAMFRSSWDEARRLLDAVHAPLKALYDLAMPRDLKGAVEYLIDHSNAGWSRVSAAEHLLSIEQEKTIAAARECGRLVERIAYWAYCTWEGMFKECPEKRDELLAFLGGLGIDPYATALEIAQSFIGRTCMTDRERLQTKLGVYERVGHPDAEPIRWALAEIDRALAEIDRLRAALAVFADRRQWRKYSSLDSFPRVWFADTDPIDFARRALEGPK